MQKTKIGRFSADYVRKHGFYRVKFILCCHRTIGIWEVLILVDFRCNYADIGYAIGSNSAIENRAQISA
jgi:hypothetical protein